MIVVRYIAGAAFVIAATILACLLCYVLVVAILAAVAS